MGDANTEQEWPFLCILKLLKKESNKDFKKLQELCQGISEDMPDMKISTDLGYMSDAEEEVNLIPVEVRGDGSCLFRALSFLCSGHQNRHRELRLRCIIEMATNKDRYLKDKKLLERIRAEEKYILNKNIASAPKTSESDDPASCGNQNDNGIANGSDEEGDSQAAAVEAVEADFIGCVFNTCIPNTFATYWHIQALAVILKRKIKIVCVSEDEGKELKELREHLDSPIEPQALGVHLMPGELDDPPLTIKWNLDWKHFEPLIPAAIKEEVDSGLGKSLESDTTYVRNEPDVGNGDDDVVGEPSSTSTPKKAVEDKANVKPKQDEDSDRDDEIVDITSGDVDSILAKLKKLLNCDIKVKNVKQLGKKTLHSLTGPYQIADPNILGILKKGTALFVTKLIEYQFQIKWKTNDGRPERFNFYELCNVEKYEKKGMGKTAHLKYDPRRAHVFTELYRKATEDTMTRKQRDKAFCAGKDKEDFCPDVYVKVNDDWVKIHFASKQYERIDKFEKRFSWMHKSLRKFVADKGIKPSNPSNADLDYKSITNDIRGPTLYWAVLEDTDFMPGDHLKLHEIGQTQVYVGKADGGIENRWIKGANSHSKQMKKCAEQICKMGKSFDVSRLEGIQLVDARLLLAKINNENHAVFLIQAFENKEDLEEAEKQHRQGKRIGETNSNIVPYNRIQDTWSPKKMEFGMNYN